MAWALGKSDGEVTRDEVIAHLSILCAATDLPVNADCLYAPAVTDPAEIKAIVEAVAPKPLNVLFWGDDMTVDSLAKLGVRRVSTGGALAAAAWAGFDAAAKRLVEQGRL
jgi:2-methylisocitrate lyase-like PEP mutase family enzyme